MKELIRLVVAVLAAITVFTMHLNGMWGQQKITADATKLFKYKTDVNRVNKTDKGAFQ